MNDHIDETIGISIFTYAEFLYMIDKSQQLVENRSAIEEFLATVDLYFIDEETATIYSRIKVSIFNQFAPKDKNKRRQTSMNNYRILLQTSAVKSRHRPNRGETKLPLLQVL